MKAVFCLLLTIVCLWSCSGNQTRLDIAGKDIPKSEPTHDAANTYRTNAEKNNENGNSANFSENKSSDNQPKNDLKINVYENGRLTSSFIYRKSILQKVIYPDSKNDGDGIEDNPNLKEFADKVTDTGIANYKQLQTEGIKILFPELILTEINNIATMLGSTDFYSNLKKEETRTGDERIIRFADFNHSVRFYPSDNGIPEDALITSYELILKKGCLDKEIYRYKSGSSAEDKANSLVRKYTYEGDKLMKVIAVNTSEIEKESAKTVTEKEFKYQAAVQ